MSIFFTSDLHFGHKNILKLGKGRPFSSIEEHDETLINNWNNTVAMNDTVYVLGDVSLSVSQDKLKEKLIRLNGLKHLILGNHDKMNEQVQFLALGIWKSVNSYATIRVNCNDNPYKIILSHYPILEFDNAYREWCFHLYGHVHNMTCYDDIYKSLGFKALHIGVDTSAEYPNTQAYSPIKLENIILRLKENFKMNEEKK